jgi:hypothetical protein
MDQRAADADRVCTRRVRYGIAITGGAPADARRQSASVSSRSAGYATATRSWQRSRSKAARGASELSAADVVGVAVRSCERHDAGARTSSVGVGCADRGERPRSRLMLLSEDLPDAVGSARPEPVPLGAFQAA